LAPAVRAVLVEVLTGVTLPVSPASVSEQRHLSLPDSDPSQALQRPTHEVLASDVPEFAAPRIVVNDVMLLDPVRDGLEARPEDDLGYTISGQVPRDQAVTQREAEVRLFFEPRSLRPEAVQRKIGRAHV